MSKGENMNTQPQGQIITFYSYKGGTGRSMSLANVACLLAERQSANKGKGVLMIDWDLEAPGLHRYFQDRLVSRNASSTDNCDNEPGLIDLFYELKKETENFEFRQKKNISPQSPPLSSEEAAQQIIEDVSLEKYIIPTEFDNLSLLKAGCFDPDAPNEYSERVNRFRWEDLYEKSPHLMRVFAETLAEKYAYVLIDSRTGITDVSGICTMLLPEKLVVVFTPNNQSLKGVIDIVRRSTEYRKESGDLRSLVVFPLVSRVESNEPELRNDWRFGSKKQKITGYQPEFEKVLAEVYNKEKVILTKYFDEIQIQHIAKYAYGEEIAVLTEKTDDKFSLTRSYRTFTDKLVESKLPWEGEADIFYSSPGSRMEFEYSCYISYPRGQKDILGRIVKNFVEGLEMELSIFTNKRVFTDHKLKSGDLLDEVIGPALCKSACMILFYTPLYLDAQHLYCAKELLAMERLEEQRMNLLKNKSNNLIIPIVLRGAKTLPEAIRNKRLYYDFTDIEVNNPNESIRTIYSKEIRNIAQYIDERCYQLESISGTSHNCDAFRLPSDEEAKKYVETVLGKKIVDFDVPMG